MIRYVEVVLFSIVLVIILLILGLAGTVVAIVAGPSTYRDHMHGVFVRLQRKILGSCQ